MDSIVFDGSAESLATALELVLGVPARHDFGCRPSNGHCTPECIHRKNIRKVAETALLEYRREQERLGETDPEPRTNNHLQWRH